MRKDSLLARLRAATAAAMIGLTISSQAFPGPPCTGAPDISQPDFGNLSRLNADVQSAVAPIQLAASDLRSNQDSNGDCIGSLGPDDIRILEQAERMHQSVLAGTTSKDQASKALIDQANQMSGGDAQRRRALLGIMGSKLLESDRNAMVRLALNQQAGKLTPADRGLLTRMRALQGSAKADKAVQQAGKDLALLQKHGLAAGNNGLSLKGFKMSGLSDAAVRAAFSRTFPESASKMGELTNPKRTSAVAIGNEMILPPAKNGQHLPSVTSAEQYNRTVEQNFKVLFGDPASKDPGLRQGSLQGMLRSSAKGGDFNASIERISANFRGYGDWWGNREERPEEAAFRSAETATQGAFDQLSRWGFDRQKLMGLLGSIGDTRAQSGANREAAMKQLGMNLAAEALWPAAFLAPGAFAFGMAVAGADILGSAVTSQSMRGGNFACHLGEQMEAKLGQGIAMSAAFAPLAGLDKLGKLGKAVQWGLAGWAGKSTVEAGAGTVEAFRLADEAEKAGDLQTASALREQAVQGVFSTAQQAFFAYQGFKAAVTPFAGGAGKGSVTAQEGNPSTQASRALELSKAREAARVAEEQAARSGSPADRAKAAEAHAKASKELAKRAEELERLQREQEGLAKTDAANRRAHEQSADEAYRKAQELRAQALESAQASYNHAVKDVPLAQEQLQLRAEKLKTYSDELHAVNEGKQGLGDYAARREKLAGSEEAAQRNVEALDRAASQARDLLAALKRSPDRGSALTAKQIEVLEANLKTLEAAQRTAEGQLAQSRAYKEGLDAQAATARAKEAQGKGDLLGEAQNLQKALAHYIEMAKSPNQREFALDRIREIEAAQKLAVEQLGKPERLEAARLGNAAQTAADHQAAAGAWDQAAKQAAEAAKKLAGGAREQQLAYAEFAREQAAKQRQLQAQAPKLVPTKPGPNPELAGSTQKVQNLGTVDFGEAAYQGATQRMKTQVDQWIAQAEQAGDATLAVTLKSHKQHLLDLDASLTRQADELAKQGYNVERIRAAIWTHDIGKFVPADASIQKQQAVGRLLSSNEKVRGEVLGFLEKQGMTSEQANAFLADASQAFREGGRLRILSERPDIRAIVLDANGNVRPEFRNRFAEFMDHAETTRRYLAQNPLLSEAGQPADALTRQLALDGIGHDGPSAPGSWWEQNYKANTGKNNRNPYTKEGEALRYLDRENQTQIAQMPDGTIQGGPRKIALQRRNGNATDIEAIDDGLNSVPEGTAIQGQYLRDNASAQRPVPGRLDQAIFDRVGEVRGLRAATTLFKEPNAKGEIGYVTVNGKRYPFSNIETFFGTGGPNGVKGAAAYWWEARSQGVAQKPPTPPTSPGSAAGTPTPPSVQGRLTLAQDAPGQAPRPKLISPQRAMDDRFSTDKDVPREWKGQRVDSVARRYLSGTLDPAKVPIKLTGFFVPGSNGGWFISANTRGRELVYLLQQGGYDLSKVQLVDLSGTVSANVRNKLIARYRETAAANGGRFPDDYRPMLRVTVR